MYRAFPGSQRNIFNKEWEGRRRVKSPFRLFPLEKSLGTVIFPAETPNFSS